MLTTLTEKTMKSLLVVVLAALLLPAVSYAQSTPFTQDPFSVTFHGPVLSKTYGHPGEDSTNEYYSRANGIYQAIAVRTISHNIGVSYNSTDYYILHDCEGSAGKDCARDTSVDFSHNYINGHPSSYGFYTFTFSGASYTQRVLAIMVDSRTFIRVLQVSPAADPAADRREWLDFTNSLRFLR